MYIMDNIIELFLRYNDNTIFIVIGDHAESFGDNGFLRHGFSLYNTEIKVPFYIRHPVFSDAPVYTSGTILDIYPSLLDILGVETPEQTQGKSFFCENYKLNIFLKNWKEGENMGFISGDKKFIYSGKNDRLMELDFHDTILREITGQEEKEGFQKFLNSNY
jgi:arylsulfatase A-like enzyme